LVPTVPEQRLLLLECAAARVLHRVAFLRSPTIPPPLAEVARKMHTRVTAPVPVRRLVPVALELYKGDLDGVACEASFAWLRAQVDDHPELQPVLDDVRRSRDRWHRARQAVVQANLRLGLSIVLKRFSRSPAAPEDLFQDAVFGLAKAADRFDPNYGVRFSTYATWWIRHAIQRSTVNTFRLVRIPAHVCNDLARYNLAIHELGDDATDEQISVHAKLSIKHVRRMADLRVSQIPLSLDHPMFSGTDDQSSLMDHVVAPTADPDDAIYDDQRARLLDRMLEELPPRSQQILAKRYGLNDTPKYTLAETGEQVGLSRERVRQLEGILIKRMSAVAARAQCDTSRV
jgi:RNA polymerase sigma factor (sigma-70 family)